MLDMKTSVLENRKWILVCYNVLLPMIFIEVMMAKLIKNQFNILRFSFNTRCIHGNACCWQHWNYSWSYWSYRIIGRCSLMVEIYRKVYFIRKYFLYCLKGIYQDLLEVPGLHRVDPGPRYYTLICCKNAGRLIPSFGR